MITVESSNIEALSYDGEIKVCTVQFKGGARYAYSNVEQETFFAILHAESIGKSFHKHIKSQPDAYPFVKVPVVQ